MATGLWTEERLWLCCTVEEPVFRQEYVAGWMDFRGGPTHAARLESAGPADAALRNRRSGGLACS